MKAGAGYSATPLAKKLGFTPPLTVAVHDAPEDYREWLGALPEGVVLAPPQPGKVRAAHVFAIRQARLKAALKKLRKSLEPDGFVWASWPKKASGVETDITEDAIRAIALPMGFVDVKVCAVTEIWSGLKLVIRKSERTG